MIRGMLFALFLNAAFVLGRGLGDSIRSVECVGCNCPFAPLQLWSIMPMSFLDMGLIGLFNKLDNQNIKQDKRKRGHGK